MYVLESDSPQGNYVFKGKIAAKTDEWAIDGTVLQLGKQLYFTALFCVVRIGEIQRRYLYIARMSNPWTIEGDRVMISTPTELWENTLNPLFPVESMKYQKLL